MSSEPPPARSVIVTGVRIEFSQMVELAFQGLIAVLVALFVIAFVVGGVGFFVVLVLAGSG